MNECNDDDGDDKPLFSHLIESELICTYILFIQEIRQKCAAAGFLAIETIALDLANRWSSQ